MPFRRALSKLRKGGIRHLIRTIVDYVRWRIWNTKGYYSLTANSVSANFIAENQQSVWTNRWLFQAENNELEDILDEIKQDDVFYDVGANVGLYSCFAEQICREVISFEPYSENIIELRQNVSINKGTTKVIELALSNANSSAFLSVPEEPRPGYGRGAMVTVDSNGESIQTVRGDLLVENGIIPPPNVIKIDVEGAEYAVIEGLKGTLQRDNCRLIYCEVHPPSDGRQLSGSHNGINQEAIRSLLEECGFAVRIAGERNDTYTLKAIK